MKSAAFCFVLILQFADSNCNLISNLHYSSYYFVTLFKFLRGAVHKHFINQKFIAKNYSGHINPDLL